MTNYTPSRIERILARSHRYRKRCLNDDEFEKGMYDALGADEDTPHNDTYELRPDEADDGRIIRKRLDD